MKKILLFILLPAMMFMTACEMLPQSGEGLTEVTEQIADINEQIAAMKGTLKDLKDADEELRKTIEGLKNSGENDELIAELQNQHKALEDQITSLENAINSTKDWASTTFATLKQQKELAETLASLSETVKALQDEIGGIETLLGKMVEDCKASLQGWISDKLAGYCTLAEAQAAVESMKKEMEDGDKVLQGEIEALEKELADMEARLTEAYKKAIEEALKNDGTIPPSADPDNTNKELEALLAEVSARIAVLENRVNEIGSQVASIKEQIAAMQATLELLKKTDEELRATIELLKNSGNGGGNGSADNIDAIIELQKKQQELEEQMKAIEKATEKATNDVKDWATTTFATLEQQNKLSETLALLAETVKTLQGKVDWLEISLAEMIEECSASLKTWVNEQLSGYYTLAEAQAALAAMKAGIADGDKALQDDIDALEKELADMEARLTEAYKKAIEEALKNGGTIPPTTDFEGADGDLGALIARIANLEKRLDEIESTLSELVNRVQQINYVLGNHNYATEETQWVGKSHPYNEDEPGVKKYSFYITPKKHVTEIAKRYQEILSFQLYEIRAEVIGPPNYYHTATYDDVFFTPVNCYEIPIESCEADAANGTLTIEIATKNIPEEVFIRDHVGVSRYQFVLSISDGRSEIQSEGYPVVYEYYNIENIERNSYVQYYGETITLDSVRYPSLKDEIICAYTSFDYFINKDEYEWFTMSVDKNTNSVTLNFPKNNTTYNRTGEVFILTHKSCYTIYLEQFSQDWILSSDKSVLDFSYTGGTELATIYHNPFTGLNIDTHGSDWFDVSIYNSGYEYSELSIYADRQVAFYNSDIREGLITISDNFGKTIDVKIRQDLITIDEASIKADKQEVNFPYSGGTETITLTHPENAEIRVEGSWGFECQIIPVNETTSTLEITARETNREPEARETTISLQLYLDHLSAPVTEIKVTQAAITPEEATIKADRSEVNFPYAGGTESITLTHPKNTEIRVDGEGDYWSFEYEIIPVNETTSTLRITADENRDSETKTAIITLQLDGFYFELPITEIKVTQAVQ